jgi:membrane protease YdiL (CAAX protease family)
MNMVFSLNFLTLAASAAPAANAAPAMAISPLLVLAVALIFLCGLICDAYLLARFVGSSQFKVTTKPWGLPELGIVVAVCIGILLTCNMLYLGLSVLLHKAPERLTSVIIPIEFATRVIVLIGFVFFFRARRYNLRDSLGLSALPAGQAVRWGIVFGFAAIPPILLVNLAAEHILRLFHFEPSEQDIVMLFRSTDSTVLLVTLILFAVVLAPVFEEFLFRGFAYPAIKQRTGAALAMIIVSIVFALTHFHAPSLLALMLLAIGLNLAYELTGSLITPIIMHAIFNAVMVLKLIYDRIYS